MMDGERPTFDHVGLFFIERYWWRESRAQGLAKFLQHFLHPDAGEGWFRSPEGDWQRIEEQNWDAWNEELAAMAELWFGGANTDGAYFDALKERTGCAFFVDAARFRTCVPDPDGLPEEFYVGFEADWSFNPDAGGVVFTPHFRATNSWPTSDLWAPDRSLPAPQPLSASDAAALLENGLWHRVETEFRAAKTAMGLLPARLELDGAAQQPPVFYYVAPTERPREAEEYLQGHRLRALDELGLQLLGTPDMRSTEITGGVMEGCLAVFNHSPKVQTEYCLMMPLAGFDEAHVESKIHFVTYRWHDIDFDATWEIYDITTDLEAEQQFYSLWMGSLSTGMSLSEVLFSLLRKIPIQLRMFSLAQLLTGFLANLQARTYAGAKKRKQLQRNMEWSIRSSKAYAQRVFTVREIAGVELLSNVSDGYTRVYRAFEETIGRAVERARELAEQIEDVSKSLSFTAGLEEERQERERKLRQEREEKAAKRLNLVLALVAVLAAIPLIVGQFDTSTLADAIGWFPFQVGLYFSFGTALVAFTATVVAIVMTVWKGNGASEEQSPDGFVAKVDARSDALFDAYRSYEHLEVQSDIATLRQAAGEPSTEDRAAGQRIHDFDVRTARTVALAMEQAAEWSRFSSLPKSDEGWAQSMEARVCRFVLLSDVFDLRPENLYLPVTLCLYRLKYEAAGLAENPVSDWEFERVMNGFGYSDEALGELGSWADQKTIAATSPSDFVDACVDAGISARRPLDSVPHEVSHI